MKHFVNLIKPLTVIFMVSSCSFFNRQDDTFKQLSEQFITDYLRWSPQDAIALGYHEYDAQLPDFSKGSVTKQIGQLKDYADKFGKIDTTKLSENNLIDYYVLQSQIKKSLFELEELKATERPLSYLSAVDITSYVKRDYAPANQRLKAIIKVQQQIPALLAIAKQNLSNVNFKEEVLLAIDAFKSNADYMEKDVPKAFEKVYQKGLQDSLKVSTQIATKALRDFSDFLKTTTLPNAKGSFAIGRANYIKMLQYNEMLDTTPEAILAIGLAKLKEEQVEFAKAAKIIDPRKSTLEVFKSIQKEHPTADSLIAFTKNKCEDIRQFLIDKHIISLPSEIRAKVVTTPAFMVGATAAMDTPGPFEKPEASEAYYYVTPPSKSWTPKQQEEWLTLFNKYSTEIISIHEAYPGHYVQFLHLNHSKVSVPLKLFSSYAFVEGWAHYTEQMMLEEGYRQGDKITQAKYKMAQLSESLLRLCRLVVSIKEHTAGWSVQDGTKFLMENCYYEEKPAYEEALRGTYDPGYLSYSLGKLQILALRDELKKKQGSQFSLQKFHDDITDNGMPPIQLLRRILVK